MPEVRKGFLHAQVIDAIVVSRVVGAQVLSLVGQDNGCKEASKGSHKADVDNFFYDIATYVL